MKALVIGDGPAGLLAATLLRKVGIGVTVLHKGSNANDQHVHILSQQLIDVAAQIDPDLELALSGELREGWRWHRWNGQEWQDEITPRLSRQGVMQALRQQCEDLRFQAFVKGELQFDLSEGRFFDQHAHFDLCIDASGNSRITLPYLKGAGFAVDLEEIGAPTLFRSWLFTRPAQIAAGQSWIYQDPINPQERAYLESEAQTLRLTCTSPRQESHGSSHEPRWRATPLAGIVPRALEMKAYHTLVSPPVRHLQINELDLHPSPAWIAFGDALLQIPAQSGAGLQSLFLQGHVLKTALENTWNPRNLRSDLAGFARTAAIQVAGMMTLAGSLTPVDTRQAG